MADKSANKQANWDIMNNPEALANAQSAVDSRSKAYEAYQGLHPTVKRRIRAMKKLQFEILKVEAEFFRQMNEIDRQFESKYKTLYEKRRDIVVGEVEPTDEECDWKDDIEQEEANVNALAVDFKDKANLESGDKQDSVKGVPDFWLTIFRNVPILSESKEDCDDPILSSLKDIQCHVNPPDSRPGFTLEFHFAPNDYFTDSVLRKEYFVRFDPSQNDPLDYEGPEIIESKGCVIHWKPSKNVTVRTVKKTMKHKNRDEKKTLSKTVKTNSFFNFFDPPKGCIDDIEEDDDEDQERGAEMQDDFELGQFIREQVIPRAVLLYTGEGIDDDEDYEMEGEDDEDDDEDVE